jgi:L-threonylcarbamoyladenylate synthase
VNRLRIDATLPDPSVIETAAAVIRRGALVAFPTDTLYGLAADPFNRAAVRRVFTVKRRSAEQALPLVAADLEQLLRHLGELPVNAQRLSARFWPGPLTILFQAPPMIAVEATGGTGRIGVRVPDHRVALDLCRACDRPLTATSANISGQPASDDPDVVAASLVDSDVDVLLDSGRTMGGRPSTIVDLTGAEARLIRAGAISWEEIRACLEA